MSEFAAWLVGLVGKIFSAAWNFVTDVIIGIVSLFLSAVLAIINALPLPSFMQAGGMQALFNNIPGEVWYFASAFKLGECMAMFGAAVAFRIARKAATLFQW